MSFCCSRPSWPLVLCYEEPQEDQYAGQSPLVSVCGSPLWGHPVSLEERFPVFCQAEACCEPQGAHDGNETSM